MICPQSTDTNRDLPQDHLDDLIQNFNKIYNKPVITIASMNKSDFRVECDKFFLEKTAISSEKFIDLIKESSLVVCPDSGPLHIALALKKDLLAVFRSTMPEIVINSDSYLKVIRV